MNVLRYWHTIRYLKPRQIFYRLWYAVKRKFAFLFVSPSNNFPPPAVPNIHWPVRNANDFFDEEKNSFIFLNVTVHFDGVLDWAYKKAGLLWNFHLHYFNWLHAPGANTTKKLELMHHFVAFAPTSTMHAYTASIRLRNWFIFLQQHNNKSPGLWGQMWKDAQWIASFPEYDVDANHLMENAISLYWAGLIFNNAPLLRQGKRLLQKQINIQILADGAHYELCPSYHLDIAQSLMQTLALAKAYEDVEQETILVKTIGRMLGWARAICYPDGWYPLIGDGIANRANVLSLLTVAQDMKVSIPQMPLSESGFRKWCCGETEFIFNMKGAYPSYQPGHQHADEMSFYLWHKDKEIIGDTGISTYEEGELRLFQRSAAAHNTITINGNTGHELWKAFRLGRRPTVSVISEDKIQLKVVTRYNWKYKYEHWREVCSDKQKLYICDRISLKDKLPITFKVHCTPDCRVTILDNCTVRIENLLLEYTGYNKVVVENYALANNFNEIKESMVVVAYGFTNQLLKLTISPIYATRCDWRCPP